MDEKKYILFIDSGIGGLSILDTFLSKKSNVNVIYYADVFNFPYGIKSEDQIGNILCNIYKNISNKFQIKMIVIACNTASISALDLLRSKIKNIPIVGTVPAIKTAATHTKNGKIGIVATETSLKQNYVNNLIKEFAKDKQVFIKPSRRLVEAAENFLPENEVAQVIKEELQYFKDNEIDSIVLGCTHYSFLFSDIQTFFENKVEVIDSRDGVSNRIISLLPDEVLDKNPTHTLILSKNDDAILQKYKKFNEMLSLFTKVDILETKE